MDVIFDRAKAQALNVTIGTAATAARAAFGGAIATQFETADGLEQVQVIYPAQLQTTLSELANVPIRTNTGQIVHLGDFSHFQSDPVSPLITRVDRNTVIHLSANITADTSLSNVQAAFLARVKDLNLPKNIIVRPRPLGQQDFMQQTLVGLGTSLILSIMLVFLLMVALYNSYRSPFIIMFSVPVAAVGALGALYLTHSTLNLFSLIGTILLVGIVTKNGILLVDYANTLRERGESKLKAIQESAFTRFRPIIMTSISVIAGNIDTATVSGKLFLHIFAAMAEFERELTRERTMAGLKAAADRGRKGGRPRLMGLKDALMCFLETTYAAGADAAKWDRKALERPVASAPCG